MGDISATAAPVTALSIVSANQLMECRGSQFAVRTVDVASNCYRSGLTSLSTKPQRVSQLPLKGGQCTAMAVLRVSRRVAVACSNRVFASHFIDATNELADDFRWELVAVLPHRILSLYSAVASSSGGDVLLVALANNNVVEISFAPSSHEHVRLSTRCLPRCPVSTGIAYAMALCDGTAGSPEGEPVTGPRAVLGAFDGRLVVWGAYSGTTVAVAPKAHKGVIFAVAAAPVGGTLPPAGGGGDEKTSPSRRCDRFLLVATGSDDRTSALWLVADDGDGKTRDTSSHGQGLQQRCGDGNAAVSCSAAAAVGEEQRHQPRPRSERDGGRGGDVTAACAEEAATGRQTEREEGEKKGDEEVVGAPQAVSLVGRCTTHRSRVWDVALVVLPQERGACLISGEEDGTLQVVRCGLPTTAHCPALAAVALTPTWRRTVTEGSGLWRVAALCVSIASPSVDALLLITAGSFDSTVHALSLRLPLSDERSLHDDRSSADGERRLILPPSPAAPTIARWRCVKLFLCGLVGNGYRAEWIVVAGDESGTVSVFYPLGEKLVAALPLPKERVPSLLNAKIHSLEAHEVGFQGKPKRCFIFVGLDNGAVVVLELAVVEHKTDVFRLVVLCVHDDDEGESLLTYIFPDHDPVAFIHCEHTRVVAHRWPRLPDEEQRACFQLHVAVGSVRSGGKLLCFEPSGVVAGALTLANAVSVASSDVAELSSTAAVHSPCHSVAIVLFPESVGGSRRAPGVCVTVLSKYLLMRLVQRRLTARDAVASLSLPGACEGQIASVAFLRLRWCPTEHSLDHLAVTSQAACFVVRCIFSSSSLVVQGIVSALQPLGWTSADVLRGPSSSMAGASSSRLSFFESPMLSTSGTTVEVRHPATQLLLHTFHGVRAQRVIDGCTAVIASGASVRAAVAYCNNGVLAFQEASVSMPPPCVVRRAVGFSYHSKEVHALHRFKLRNSSSAWLISASEDTTITIRPDIDCCCPSEWRFSSEFIRLHGHRSNVRCLAELDSEAYSDRYLVSGGGLDTLCVWNSGDNRDDAFPQLLCCYESGVNVSQMAGKQRLEHRDTGAVPRILCLAPLPSSLCFLSGDSEGNIKMWCVRKRSEEPVPSHRRGRAATPPPDFWGTELNLLSQTQLHSPQPPPASSAEAGDDPSIPQRSPAFAVDFNAALRFAVVGLAGFIGLLHIEFPPSRRFVPDGSYQVQHVGSYAVTNAAVNAVRFLLPSGASQHEQRTAAVQVVAGTDGGSVLLLSLDLPAINEPYLATSRHSSTFRLDASWTTATAIRGLAMVPNGSSFCVLEEGKRWHLLSIEPGQEGDGKGPRDAPGPLSSNQQGAPPEVPTLSPKASKLICVRTEPVDVSCCACCFVEFSGRNREPVTIPLIRIAVAGQGLSVADDGLVQCSRF